MNGKKRLLFCMFLFPALAISAGCRSEDSDRRQWRVYLGDKHSSQYSELDQINRQNVSRLRPVWTYETGDKSEDNLSQIQCNPIVIDGVLYGTSPHIRVFALNAASGEQIWTFDPFAHLQTDPVGVNRGVTYWSDGSDRRILFSAGHYLFALNADDGQLISGFGDGGKVDLRGGLDREIGDLYVGSTTPGVVYKDLLILGTRVGEGPGKAAPGHIRAFDVLTGERRWIFHTIPREGEFGADTWPEGAWQTGGGANSWSGMSLDEKRGLVFVPTGSPAFDFWGGNRPGQNLFGNSVLALRAATGERVWHFQVVHHDLWDRDLPAPPNLVTVRRNGRTVDAVAQITKSGHVFLFERETGELLFPVEEVSVPASDLEGEAAWPTQPIPSRPPAFARQRFTDNDVTNISPEAAAYVRAKMKGVRNDGQFVPPSADGTMIFPGFDGGGEWGGAAFDPETGLLYVNANEMPWILRMVRIEATGGSASPGRSVYDVHCAVCHGANLEGEAQGTFPALTGMAEKYDDRRSLETVVRNGKGFMPGFAQLSEEETEVLVDFLLGEESSVPSWALPPPDIPYTHTGYNRFLDPEGYPAVKPPWGTLNAIDLNDGTLLWQVPLGEFEELTARGIPRTGTENYGGPVVTAGGLIFIGATKDEKFRAFDKQTGEMLWEANLPAGGYATPCTYEVERKQYVVIAAGGGKMGTKSGDSYVAFALP